MASGILIVDKPASWTSHDVVAKLRGVLQERRIGHAGTLDPMATGVLPVFVGRATRAVEFASEREKEYIAGLRLGTVTDTQDITGTVLSQTSNTISRRQLSEVLPMFHGPIAQIPPMFSAVKIKGKKLYELARVGKDVPRKPRPVTIYSLEILDQTSPCDFILRVSCSKGTYIRTLCHDMGERLGTGGCLFSLRRTKAAGFSLNEAHSLDEILSHSDPSSFLLPVDKYFAEYPALTVSPLKEKYVRNGMRFPFCARDGNYRVYSVSGEFLMVGRIEKNMLITIKSFFEVY